MAKISQLDRAIADTNAKIAVLVQVREALEAQKPPQGKPKAAKKRAAAAASATSGQLTEVM